MPLNLNSHPLINCFLSKPANPCLSWHSLCYGAMGGLIVPSPIGSLPRDPAFTGSYDVAAREWGHVTCAVGPQRFQDSSKILVSSVCLAVLPAVKRSEEPRPPSLPTGCCETVMFQSPIARRPDVRCVALLSRPFRRLAGPLAPGGHR